MIDNQNLVEFPPENDPVVLKQIEQQKVLKQREVLKHIGEKTRLQLASLIQKGREVGMDNVIQGIIKYTNSDIETWKNTGDTDYLNQRLSGYTGKTIRGYLDTMTPSGLTVQQFIIQFLKGY